MPNVLLGQSELTPESVHRVTSTIVSGYPRVLSKHPEAVVRKGLELKSVLERDADVEGPLKDLLSLDDEWKAMGTDLGIVAPDGPRPMAVCGGMCIFAAGVVVGVVVSKM